MDTLRAGLYGQNVKIGKYVVKDTQYGDLMPSKILHFKPSGYQYPVKDTEWLLQQLEDGHFAEKDEFDAKITDWIRRDVLPFWRNQGRLTQRFFLKPMIDHEDEYGVLTGVLDVTSNMPAWLLMHDPRYLDYVCDMAQAWMYGHENDTDRWDSLCHLFVDYARFHPLSSVIVNDGSQYNEAWHREFKDIVIFGEINGYFQTYEMLTAELADCLPNDNITKSTAFDNITSDGTVVTQSDVHWGVDEIATSEDKKVILSRIGRIPNNLFRKHNGFLRQDMIESQKNIDDFEWFVENCDKIGLDFEITKKAILKEVIYVMFDGYRENCPDALRVSYEEFKRDPVGAVKKACGKVRRLGRQLEEDLRKYIHGAWDGKKRIEFLRRMQSEHPEYAVSDSDVVNRDGNRKRLINNGNPKFAVPLQMIEAGLMRRWEDSTSGFPTYNPRYLSVIEKFKHMCPMSQGYVYFATKVDTENSEQNTGDNQDCFLAMDAPWLQRLDNGSLCYIGSSFGGPDFRRGVASGTHETTRDSEQPGRYNYCSLTTRVILPAAGVRVPFAEVAEKELAAKWLHDNVVTYDGGRVVTCFVGVTDDGKLLWAVKLADSELSPDDPRILAYAKRFDELYQPWKQGRWIKSSELMWGDREVPGFGTEINLRSLNVRVRSADNLHQHDWMEHVSNGNLIAFKMICRSENMHPDDAIARDQVRRKHGMRPISELQPAADRGIDYLHLMGLENSGLFNEWQPSTQYVVSKLAEQYGFKPNTTDKIYSSERMRPYWNIFMRDFIQRLEVNNYKKHFISFIKKYHPDVEEKLESARKMYLTRR